MSTAFRSYIPEIPSLIAAYAGNRGSSRIGKEINKVWGRVWLQATDERFVNWLVHEGVIDFCGLKAKTDGVNLFSKHIAPLLLDAASIPQEREFLYNLANHLQSSSLFLTIIPYFGKTSAKDGGSFTSRAVQGIPAALAPGCPTEATATQQSLDLFAESIDSFAVEFLMDDPSLQLLEDSAGEWHLGTTTSRSTLLHELTHVLDMVTEARPRGNKSYRWTNPDEECTITRENAFLHARGEMVRLSHKQPTTLQMYTEQSCTLRLVDALFLAADGSARELAEEGLMAEEGSLERLGCDEKSLSSYASSYLAIFMQIESQEIDLAYKNEIIVHKNLALEKVINAFLQRHPQGYELASHLIELALKKAPEFGRDDAIPFVEAQLEKLTVRLRVE